MHLTHHDLITVTASFTVYPIANLRRFKGFKMYALVLTMLWSRKTNQEQTKFNLPFFFLTEWAKRLP